MLDASSRADALVAPEYNQRLEPVVVRPIRVGKAVVQRVLAGEERDNRGSRHVAAKIDHEVAEIVFLFRSDGAVREEDEGARARQASHRVIGIDPGVHACGGFELRARWPELRRDHRAARTKVLEKGLHRARSPVAHDYTDG